MAAIAAAGPFVAGAVVAGAGAMFAAKATARGVACSGDAREASGNAGAGLMGGIWSARGNSAPGSAGRAGVRFAVALA
jgi:hypothetical protein